jgi:hypothetical protein
MYRTAIITLVAFLAGLLAASTLPSAVAGDKQDDPNALKYPWAGKDLNKPVTMTKLDLIITVANAEPISKKDSLIWGSTRRPMVVVNSYKAKATAKGLHLVADVAAKQGLVLSNVIAEKALKAWAVKHAKVDYQYKTWPVAVTLCVGEKKVLTHVRKGE